jgi:hypothetical protein
MRLTSGVIAHLVASYGVMLGRTSRDGGYRKASDAGGPGGAAFLTRLLWMLGPGGERRRTCASAAPDC